MVSAKTEKIYNFYLSKLDNDRLTDKQYILDFIEPKSASARKIILSAILRKAPQDWIREEIKKNIQLDLLHRIKRPPTNKENENFMEWEDIIKLREELKEKKKNLRDEMKYVALCMFTYIPPLRSQCFYNCYVNEDVSGSNKICLETGTLVLNEYKTKKTYGQKILTLPPKLVKIVEEWYCQNDNQQLLFFNKKNEMFNEASFSNFMYSIFKRKISSSMLRKIYITTQLKKNLSLEEREYMADLMCHSVLEQEFYYKKDFNLTVGLKC